MTDSERLARGRAPSHAIAISKPSHAIAKSLMVELHSSVTVRSNEVAADE